MNDHNLIPVTQLSPSDRKEICRKGAEATNRIKKQKKMMREVVQDMMKTEMDPELIEQLKDKFPFLKEGMDFQTAIVVGQLMSSVGGNSKAFELLSEMNDAEHKNKPNEYEEMSVEELRGLLNGSKQADNPKT